MEDKWLSSSVGCDSLTHVHLKICENIQNFFKDIFKLLVSDRSPQEAFQQPKISTLVLLMSSSPGISSSTETNDVLSTLLRPNCDSVCAGFCCHWNLSSCGVSWVHTTKLRTSDGSGNYSSLSSRSLVSKIASTEDRNTIHSVKCQCSLMSWKRDFDLRTWFLLSMQGSCSLPLFFLGAGMSASAAGWALAACVCRGSCICRTSWPGLPATATDSAGQLLIPALGSQD